MTNASDNNVVFDYTVIQNPWVGVDQNDANVAIDYTVIQNPWVVPDQNDNQGAFDYSTIVNPFVPVENVEERAYAFDFSVITNPYLYDADVDYDNDDWVPKLTDYFQSSIDSPEWKGLDDIDDYLRGWFTNFASYVLTNITAVPRWIVAAFKNFFDYGVWRYIRNRMSDTVDDSIVFLLGYLFNLITSFWLKIRDQYFFHAFSIKASALNELVAALPPELVLGGSLPTTKWDLSKTVSTNFTFSDRKIWLPNYLKRKFYPNVQCVDGKTDDELWQYIIDGSAGVGIMLAAKLPKKFLRAIMKVVFKFKRPKPVEVSSSDELKEMMEKVLHFVLTTDPAEIKEISKAFDEANKLRHM